MIARNYTDFCRNIEDYMNKVIDDYETMFVTRNNSKNVVVISEEVYNNLIEKTYLIGEKSNYNQSMKSKI